MNYKTKISKLIEQIQHYDKHKPVKLSYLWPVLFNNSDQVPAMVKHYWTQEFNGLGFITTNELSNQLNTEIEHAIHNYDYESAKKLVKTAKHIQKQTSDAQQTKYGLLYTVNQDMTKPMYVTNELFIETMKKLIK